MASILKVNELKDAGGNAIITSNGSGAVTYSGVDLNGTELVLDADADTSITADTDDQVDIKIGGTDAFRITGTALTGNAVATIGATGTASTLAGIPFFSDTSNGSIYTHNVSGTDSTAEGNAAYGLLALDAITTGDYNTAIGYQALSANNTGYSNVALGQAALLANTEGYENISLGKSSLLSNTTGDRNIAIGVRANDLADTESHNLAIGYEAMTGAVAGGEYNVAIGNYTLDALTSADYVTAVGYNAGSSIDTGGYNTFIGYGSGDALTDADGNVGVGHDTLGSNVHSDRNTAVGYGALRTHTVSSKSDSGNTAMGWAAGAEVTTGDGNTLIGHQAYATGSGNLTTGSSNVAIGMDLTLNTNSHSNSITLGAGIEGYTNRFAFGKASNVVENTFTSDANWSRSSDERLKTNITDVSWKALDFINELRPITFNWKASQDVSDTMIEHDPDKNNMDTTTVIDGLVAQEVKAAMDKHDMDNFSGWKERPNRLDKEKTQQISKEAFVMPIIKAIQELSAKVKALEDA